jgi:hypothetical protein
MRVKMGVGGMQSKSSSNEERYDAVSACIGEW